MATTAEPTSRPAMGLDDLIRHLDRSVDPLIKQLAANLGKMKQKQNELKEEARQSGEPSSYAAVMVGSVVDYLTNGMVFPDFDGTKLSPQQREFFSAVQASFPGVTPRELEEDGNVIFHGRGQVCRITPEGDITFIGDAPWCPKCAEIIMAKIDEGYTVAQCDHCGNAVRDVSTDD